MWPGELVGTVEGDECGDGANAADVAGEGFTLVDVSEEGCVDEFEGVADGLGHGVGGGSAVVVPVSPLFGFREQVFVVVHGVGVPF